MEETLTDCLVRVREDLNQLGRVRDYLDANAETDERCSVTWRTIEAFNSILSVCSSQNTPESNALDTLLDSFCYLARNNQDDNVWDDFGFELGIICVKVLSAIERTEIFEILFCKLLSVISIISEHNSNVWKAAGRQILNVIINKKVSLSYLEAILKLYICILKNIDGSALRDFSSQNLHLLKTLSLFVQKIGDFEIQSDVIELTFLHLSRETKLMSDFFSVVERNLFDSLQFLDFENDCRLYLNAINKPRRGFERKVHSICCHVLYLGGCFVEPPLGRDTIWVDANRDSERLSIRCGDVESNEDRVIYIQFSEILKARLENDKTEGNRCLTIETKALTGLQKDVKNDDICMVVENTEEVYHFMDFLEAATTKKKQNGRKSSKTMDCLLIDRSNPKVQDNSITSSERPGIDQILSDALSLFERPNQAVKSSRTPKKETKPSPKGLGEPQELSPNSFVESLNKHIGLGSPELPSRFEDSVETVEFLQKPTPVGRKLFRTPDEIFEIHETQEPSFGFTFQENKEYPSDIKTYSRKFRKPEQKPPDVQILKERKNVEQINAHSQDFFHNGSAALKKKKPSLPKLKRKAKPKAKTQNTQMDSEKENKSKPNPNLKEIQKGKKQQTAEKSETKQNKAANAKPEQQNQQTKPSLLDPEGYAYQRWCQPTTSERSNFWLRKLDETQKQKTTETIFDFSDNSITGEIKIPKRLKPKYKTRRKQTTLREVKEIIKKSPTRSWLIKKETAPPKRKETTVKPPKGCTENPPPSPQRSPPHGHEQPNVDSEYESLPDDEKQPETKKRQHSDSSRRDRKKKKNTKLPKKVFATLRQRLQKTEEKDKISTDEIIQTISKATNHLFIHLHKRTTERVMSYLDVAEAATTTFVEETNKLRERAKRIQRAILYFRAGCTMSDSLKSLDEAFCSVRAALKDLKETKDGSKMIEPIVGRLNDVIKSEIDRLMESEWEARRSRLLKCSSILGISVTSLE